ncbi:MAG: acyl-CoA/acyl-ACP dehydrogenase [Candidatus Lambdaproteobacteria bacterium]|nr:acyl-CoA/acyl-ACP dehydrogenase [Candidatus Lambdaproteobacteria bacterium]
MQYSEYGLSDDQKALCAGVRALCAKYPETYWQALDDKMEYPYEFVDALTQGGYLSALIPETYGGLGLKIKDACLILEEIHRSGGNAAACHAQMYIMGTMLRHGSEEQKRQYLPGIAKGELRLQAFGVTEPDAGSDTLSISTKAEKKGNRYVVNGRKVFISRVLQSDLMTLLCRTTPLEKVQKRTDGLSVLLVDLREARKNGLTVNPIKIMLNHHTNELIFENVEVPTENLIGEEGKGFRYILSGMNAERILVASETIGDGRYFVEKATTYANQRVVFDHPISKNQGIQFPIARAYCAVEAARLMRDKAAEMFDAGENPGEQANMAKLLGSESAWQAANVAMDTYGGYGVTSEYHIERKFREARLYQVAPVSNNMVLNFVGQNVLGMPRSY